MPSNLKLVDQHTFIDGVDTTTARELKRPTTVEYMLNCYILSQGEGSVGIVTNFKGNKEIEFTLPAGRNKSIGTAIDEENNIFLFFICNENGFHGIYKYDGISKEVSRLFENLTDSADIDIMKLDFDHLILHADIVDNDKLYWVDGLNNARKTNLSRLVDKTPNGYGAVVLQSFIDLYKQTARFAPTGIYISDTNRPDNTLYGSLIKVAQRFSYIDGEKSTYSDFSGVILPDNESFSGVNTIPTNNNGIQITVDTGSHDVKIIEVVAQFTSGEINNDGVLNWVLINTINKKDLGLADNATYSFNFYNDTDYPPVDQTDVIQPYDYILREPQAQTIAKSRLVLSNGKEGRPTVDVDVSITVRYEDLFIDPGTENKYNEPIFTHEYGVPPNDRDIVSFGQSVITADGVTIKIFPVTRFNVHKLTIGFDVKKGNKFYLSHSNGYPPDIFDFMKEATVTDSALTVANYFKQQLLATGRIFRKTPELPDTNIYDNEIDGDGNVTFSYIMMSTPGKAFMGGWSYPEPIQYDSLKDTGQSVRNEKMGSTHRYAIQYEDDDGRKEGGYTSPEMVRSIKPINDEGIKASVTEIEIRHKAPIWAKYYQILRTKDLVRDDFIELLIQNVVEIQGTQDTEYLDLVIGGYFTYKKLHPNSTLDFEFAKGDRLSLIKKTSDDTYYPFFQTEVIDYNSIISDHIKSNVVTAGTATVTVAEASVKDIGKFIIIDGNEREIVDAPSPTTYLLNAPIGDNTSATYLSYELVDRRGVLRIRKPSVDVIPEIEDLSMVEVYKPSRTAVSDQKFFEFQQKYAIINPGTETAYHAANKQNQTAVLPAIVDISGGSIYVRNREQPTNNVSPGTQVIVELVEDPSYSDFYESNVNDNGRTMAEDLGFGEVHFGSRMRFSKNFIEDTRINGLSSFPNLNREDFNDDYGFIKLTKFDTNRIFVFKELKTCFVPIDSILTKDNLGTGLLVSSVDFLNPIQYFAWEGGIGNNPESWTRNATHQYFVSANSGVIIRIGGNGEEPISKTYLLDNEVKAILTRAINNKAKIPGGFDRVNDFYIAAVEGTEIFIFFDGFTGWVVSQPVTAIEYEIVTNPAHGTIDFTSPTQWTYIPTTDYVGSDTWSYRAKINGTDYTQPANVCLTIVENPNLTTAWRPKESSYFCVIDEYGLQTGYKGWDTLEEYYIVSNELTGNEKPNVDTDANYAAPVIDETTCVPTPPDGTPNPYSFDPVIDAELDTLYESEVVTPDGYNIPIIITIADGEYRLNGGAWTSADGIMNPGDTLQVRRNSSTDYDTEVITTPTAGGVSADFSITTKEEEMGEFHSLVAGGAPTRNMTGNGSGGAPPTSMPYQWFGSLANDTVIINTLPGVELRGFLSGSNRILTVVDSGNYHFKVTGSGSVTVSTEDSSGWTAMVDFFIQINGTAYALSSFNPPPPFFTNFYQYLLESPGGGIGHKEATVAYSLSYEGNIPLTTAQTVEFFIGPRIVTTPAAKTATLRLNNTSLELEINIIP